MRCQGLRQRASRLGSHEDSRKDHIVSTFLIFCSLDLVDMYILRQVRYVFRGDYRNIISRDIRNLYGWIWTLGQRGSNKTPCLLTFHRIIGLVRVSIGLRILGPLLGVHVRDSAFRHYSCTKWQ